MSVPGDLTNMGCQAQSKALRRVGAPPVVLGQTPGQRLNQLQQYIDRSSAVHPADQDVRAVTAIHERGLGTTDPSSLHATGKQAKQCRADLGELVAFAPAEVLDIHPDDECGARRISQSLALFLVGL